MCDVYTEGNYVPLERHVQASYCSHGKIDTFPTQKFFRQRRIAIEILGKITAHNEGVKFTRFAGAILTHLFPPLRFRN